MDGRGTPPRGNYQMMMTLLLVAGIAYLIVSAWVSLMILPYNDDGTMTHVITGIIASLLWLPVLVFMAFHYVISAD